MRVGVAVTPSNCAVAAPHGHLSASSRRRQRVTPRASAQPASSLEAGAEWDPEGLLPQAPAAGHFARKEKASGAASAAAAPAAALPAVAAPRRSVGEAPKAAEESIGERIEAAFQTTFAAQGGAPRVLDSFRRLRDGLTFKQLWPGKGVQQADSYIDGLSAEPFPEVHSGAYPWLEAVEQQAAVILEEFRAAMADGGAALKAKGNKIWVPAARKEAIAYGPAWRTLVIQDRGLWEEDNSRLFPQTKKVFTDLNAPTIEVFFARQEAHTGIKSHTDNTNFIQTSHLGIDVPEGQCWIKVGDHTREWRNGKAIVCDTSFMHQTQNDADVDRYVLIMRHWHPGLSDAERVAAQFLFEAVDDPSAAGIKAAQRKALKALKGGGGGGRKKKGGSAAGGGFGGFGKRS